MKKTIKFATVILMIMILLSCNEKTTTPALSTTDITEILTTSAVSGGVIVDDGGAAIISKGVCWNTSDSPSTGNNKTTESGGPTSFTSNLTDLDPGTLYYVRAYATNSAGTGYGESVSFTTLGDEPAATATDASEITINSATINGTINPYSLSTTVAFEWGVSTEYGNTGTPAQSPVTGSTSVVVSLDLADLTPGTTYHYRIKGTNELGTAYSNDLAFKTLGAVPTVITEPAQNVTITSATLEASVNPNYLPTDFFFEFGTSTSYGSLIPASQYPFSGGEFIGTSDFFTGLNPETTYHYRIIAENELGRSIGEDVTFTTYSAEDADQNYYHSVTIGTQTWMKENLKTTKYNDNTDIPLVTDNTQWSNLTTSAFSWYDNNETANKNVYGALYNWHSVQTGKLCPSGWHVPNNSEWATLISFLGGTSSGGKLKEANYIHWQSPNTNATNESGFTALPGGNRDLGGPFYEIGRRGYWWSAEFASSTNAWYTHLSYDTPDAVQIDYSKKMGFSVRCLKD